MVAKYTIIWLNYIDNLNKRLQENEFKLHWTKYNGGLSESKIYRDLIDIFSRYASLCEFNVIRYDYPHDINKEKIDRMIYSKMPERVMYGLLRYIFSKSRGMDRVFIRV